MKIFHSFDKDRESVLLPSSLRVYNALQIEHSILLCRVLHERHKSICNNTDDGYLNATDLEQSFGRTADVKQMIAAADRNGDGKVRNERQWNQAGMCSYGFFHWSRWVHPFAVPTGRHECRHFQQGVWHADRLRGVLRAPAQLLSACCGFCAGVLKIYQDARSFSVNAKLIFPVQCWSYLSCKSATSFQNSGTWPLCSFFQSRR